MHIDQSDAKNAKSNIDIMNVENGIIYIDAPNSDVSLTLKSLHDSSYINCRNLIIYITDDFFEANFIEVNDQGVKDSILDSLEEIKEMGPKPSLFINASMSKEIKVMTSFEILKMQIMSKVKPKEKS